MKKPLMIYVHIPFCVKKCDYCDFLSFPSDEETKKQYESLLLQEIAQAGIFLKEYEVTSVYVGGGTPSLLPPSFYVELFEKFDSVFGRNWRLGEITLEANPGTLTKERLAGYREAGFNRLSMGVQSADDSELKCLGRIHTWETAKENYFLARKAGFENINLDIMFAIPGQTMESYRNTLEKIIELNPEHISSYSLILEEGTPLFERYSEDEISDEGKPDSCSSENEDGKSDSCFSENDDGKSDSCSSENEDGKTAALPDEDTDRQMYELTNEMLKQAGYYRYEISNYAKKGYEAKHNQGYWRLKEYVGLGLGASSYMGEIRFKNAEGIEEYKEELLQEHEKREAAHKVFGEDKEKKNLQHNGISNYLQEWIRCHKEIEIIDEAMSMSEMMFLGLRMCDGVSEAEFFKCFNKTIRDAYPGVIEKYEATGHLVCENGNIRLTEKGMDVSNTIMSEFVE